MLTNLKIALSVALVLVTASAAFAAPKQAARHQAAIGRQVPANIYVSFAAVRSTGSVKASGNMKIQDIGFKESLGD